MKSKTSLFITLCFGLYIAASAIKVDVCHNVDHNPVVINIAIPAAVAHLLQHPSDSLGDCKVEPFE